MGSSAGEVTNLLFQPRDGNRGAESKLIPLVYAELRRRAGRYMRGERPGHTLQATALVHEVYLRLMRYFGGLSQDETAEVLGISTRTVKRDWNVARAWLYQQLNP